MNTIEFTPEFKCLPVESISIDSSDVNLAVEMSSHIPNEKRQWQTYINALGLLTFKNWIEERNSNLKLNWEKSTIAKPSLANVIPIVTNLEVGSFKICLITVGSLFEEQVSISRLVVDSPEFIPHFYVLIEVLEEQEHGIVRGFMSYVQLTEHLDIQTNLKSQWAYQIPLTWFDEKVHNLLLHLRTLELQAITVPAIHDESQRKLVALESEITQLLPQLTAPSREICEVLSWEQGSAVLNSPELIEWIYKLQTSFQSHIASNIASLRKIIKIITQPAINLGYWLNGEIDEVGKAFSWQLLPQLAPLRTAIRSPEEEFAAIMTQLQAKGVEISPFAKYGYNNFFLAGIPLRVYVAVWNLASSNHSWSLLLVVGSTPPNTLPHNLKLTISDQIQILAEQEINKNRYESFLYTHVAGNWDEKFIASVSIGSGAEVTLPPFAFHIHQA